MLDSWHPSWAHSVMMVCARAWGPGIVNAMPAGRLPGLAQARQQTGGVKGARRPFNSSGARWHAVPIEACFCGRGIQLACHGGTDRAAVEPESSFQLIVVNCRLRWHAIENCGNLRWLRLLVLPLALFKPLQV